MLITMRIDDRIVVNAFHRVLNPAVILILTSAAIGSSITALDGCDFIELHLEALNDRGLFFEGDTSMIGLGLQGHQPLTGKNTTSWENNSTCLDYNDIETEIFLENTDLSFATDFFTKGLIVLCVSTAVIGLNTVFCSFTKNSFLFNAIFYIGIVLTFTSASLQLVAYNALDPLDSDVCDRDRYFPDGWYEDFPLHSYPEYRYMKFFAECKMGESSTHALDSIRYQFIGCAWTSLVLLSTLLFKCMRISIQKYKKDSKGCDCRKYYHSTSALRYLDDNGKDDDSSNGGTDITDSDSMDQDEKSLDII